VAGRDCKGMRILTFLLVASGALVVASAPMAAARAPVIKYKDDRFGAILATPKKQALYYWNVEKRAGGKIRCTGSCARLWPPLVVKTRSAVPKRITGIKGVFGVVKRPNGKLQVTHNGLPVYTYIHEGPKQVLCDNVDGWFVVRLK
jgi:predicted lipoprotein with Yx(FWY)xxD motif